MTSSTLLFYGLILAGFGQIGIALGSLAIPSILGWPEETRRLTPLTRQVFWTYAGYIWTSNLCFGLLSALAPKWLMLPAPLTIAVCGYICIYWGARLILQLFCFDRGPHLNNWKLRAADFLLTALFLFHTVIYAWAAWFNYRVLITH